MSASEAPRGDSSLDYGAAEPRQAYGGAAFSGRRPVSARDRLERDAEIVALAAGGLRRKRIAQRFEMSLSNVDRILNEARNTDRPERAEAAVAARDARSDSFLALYAAGYSMSEVGARHGVSATRVLKVLRTHPDFEPRSAFVRFGFDTPVPSWVPDRHVARFHLLASRNGEEVAASCLRKLKRLEAQS